MKYLIAPRAVQSRLNTYQFVAMVHGTINFSGPSENLTNETTKNRYRWVVEIPRHDEPLFRLVVTVLATSCDAVYIREFRDLRSTLIHLYHTFQRLAPTATLR